MIDARVAQVQHDRATWVLRTETMTGINLTAGGCEVGNVQAGETPEGTVDVRGGDDEIGGTRARVTTHSCPETDGAVQPKMGVTAWAERTWRKPVTRMIAL